MVNEATFVNWPSRMEHLFEGICYPISQRRACVLIPSRTCKHVLPGNECRSEDRAARASARSSHCGAIGSSPMARPEIRLKMNTIAEKRRRFGYPLAGRRLPAIAARRRIGVMLERVGMIMNEKKLYRMYREEGLSVRRRRGRKRARGSHTGHSLSCCCGFSPARSALTR